jgi:hypothetical protein
MHVRTDAISTPGDRTKGYLLVAVPSTPHEPRQVDGVYYGRGDTTRYRLAAAEVERCYQQGLRIQRDIQALLEEAVQNDPWPARRHAHLFGVAQPVSPRSDLLLRALGADAKAWHDFLHGRVRSGPSNLWYPDLPGASDVSRRAWGWALSSVEMPGRVIDTSDEHRETGVIDLEVREDGGLRLFCGGASTTLHRFAEPLEIAMELVILGLTKWTFRNHLILDAPRDEQAGDRVLLELPRVRAVGGLRQWPGVGVGRAPPERAPQARSRRAHAR